MTAELIDTLARKRELLPDSAGLAARNLYHSLVMLYKEYRNGIIDAEIAKKEKTNLFAQYGIAEIHERIWKEQSRRMVEISKVMVEINKRGCPLCQQVARLFDGRQMYATAGEISYSENINEIETESEDENERKIINGQTDCMGS